MATDKNQISSKHKLIILVYLPWIISLGTQFDPVLSYFVAWAGSFFIFYWTLFSNLRCISLDMPLSRQVMRPIVLIQLIFAGFMCSTSIFFFLDHLGYEYFNKISILPFTPNEQTYNIAKCQRLSLLAHAALVTGIIVKIKKYPVIKHRLNLNIDFFLIWLCIACYLLGGAASRIPSIVQFSFGLINIAISCSALILTRGILQRKKGFILFGGGIFVLNFLAATLTGYKESVIINIIIISFLLYPHFKKVVLVLAIPTIYLLLYVLPTFTNIVRHQSWSGEKSAEQARVDALNAILNNETATIDETNWSFLTERLSEISMFTKFVEYFPKEKDYYGIDIFYNSILAIIPRALWPGKFNTEEISMNRVYEAGVINRNSAVSAKTRPVVDGYVSAGTLGVFISIFLYGLITQALCNKAEEWFGGYELGCIIIFNAVFQSLWRGNNFEFLLNNIFYGYLAMYAIFFILKRSNTLIELDVYQDTADQRGL